MKPDELAEKVRSWSPVTGPDSVVLPDICKAVVSLVDNNRLTRRVTNDDGDQIWADDTVLGATMLAARLVRRRNSPAGIDGFTPDGAVAYIRTNDPDVARLLRLGGPAIG